MTYGEPISDEQQRAGLAAIVAYVREQARWRRTKADEHPDDDRNARSAAALDDLARWFETTGPDDLIVAPLVAMHLTRPVDVYMPSEEGGRLVSRYGFHRGVPKDPALFTAEWARAEVEAFKDVDY